METTTCGAAALSFTATDGEVTSPATTVTFEVICPPACMLSSDMTFEAGTCDQSTLTRRMVWRWRNAMLAADAPYFVNNSQCDMPRAPPLPDDVSVDCDMIALDSGLAIGIAVPCALLALCKLGLLACTPPRPA